MGAHVAPGSTCGPDKDPWVVGEVRDSFQAGLLLPPFLLCALADSTDPSYLLIDRHAVRRFTTRKRSLKLSSVELA